LALMLSAPPILTSVTAADESAIVLRSFTFAMKMTLLPSFHISVTRVSPGYTEPANLRHSAFLVSHLVRRRGIVQENTPDFDVLPWAKGLQDMLACDAHEAKTVEDGLVKSTDGGKFGLDLFIEMRSGLRRRWETIFENAHGGGSSRRSSCTEPLAWRRSSLRRRRQACASAGRS
jgi:hypothetical protein